MTVHKKKTLELKLKALNPNKTLLGRKQGHLKGEESHGDVMTMVSAYREAMNRATRYREGQQQRNFGREGREGD